MSKAENTELTAEERAPVDEVLWQRKGAERRKRLVAADRFMKRWGTYLAEGKFLTYSRRAKKTIAILAELQRQGKITVTAHHNNEIKVTA